MHRLRPSTVAAGLLAAAALALVAAAPAAAQGDAPWQRADAIRGGLASALTELILDDRAKAQAEARRAVRAYRGDLRAQIRSAAPAADAAARAALRRVERAVAGGDAHALAAARGALQGALFRGSMAVTLAAVRAGDVDTARAWLLVREFRTATRLTRPGSDATVALRDLQAKRTSPDAAAEAVQKDLLDAYQGRQRDLLGDADAAAERGLETRLSEATAQAAAYWPILAPRYVQDRGEDAADDLGKDFAALAAAGAAASWISKSSVTRVSLVPRPYSTGTSARKRSSCWARRADSSEVSGAAVKSASPEVTRSRAAR